MSARELHVLGTASQVPTRHRNHNGYFLRWDTEGILFDPGEGTQRQMTLAGLAASAITRICITHFHGDHCLGLPGIIQRLSLDGAGTVTVHYPASGQAYFDRLRRASIFASREKLECRPIEKSGVLHSDDAFVFEAQRLDHDVDCYGFRLAEKEQFRLRQEKLDAAGLKGPVVGELLKKGSVGVHRREDFGEMRPGQTFAFVMDTRPCEGARTLAKGADLLVCESTYHSAETELARESGHMTALQAGTLARDAGVRRLVIGHFSQRYDDPEILAAEARTVHREVVVAVDPDPRHPSSRHVIAVPERK
jgi:ribonuclease Z